MKKELTVYYLSRAVLSVLFGVLASLSGRIWVGILIGTIVFVGFIWYAHSGRYLIDTSTPLTPLRRDARGKEIRNRALVAAVAVGGMMYGFLKLIGLFFKIPDNISTWVLFLSVILYITISNWMYIRDNK